MAAAAAGPNGAQPGDTGSSCRLEFAVQMRCQSCADAVRASLQGAPGVRLLELRLEEQTVLVETTGGAGGVQELLEKSGCRAVLKGMGGGQEGCGGGAAVASLWGRGGVAARGGGLVRFLQLPPPRGCLLEGAVGGLPPPGPHRLQLHQFGDLSHPPESCGGLYDPEGRGPPQDQQRPLGDLGTLWVDAEGGGTFRREVGGLQLQDIIGRSLLVATGEDLVLWGVVARAAGLFQNPKRVCSCDGRSLWEERDLAVATKGPPVATDPPVATEGPPVATAPTVTTGGPAALTDSTGTAGPAAATAEPTVATAKPTVATAGPVATASPVATTGEATVATSPTATSTPPAVPAAHL